MSFEDQRRRIRESRHRGDLDGIRQAVAEIVDIAVRDAQSRGEASKVLEHLVERYGHASEIAVVLERKNSVWSAQYQKNQRYLDESARALPKRHRWIEKLILVANIQRLQSDPRLQMEFQIEKIQSELENVRHETEELTSALVRQVTKLRGQL